MIFSDLLPFYAILRSIPNKLLGFIAMILSIVILLVIPYIWKNSIIRSGALKPFQKVIFWIFVVNCILLAWIGGIPVIEPYLTVGRILSILYFVNILIIKSILSD